jgi:MFS family permease
MFGDKPLAVAGTAIFAASVFCLPLSQTVTLLIIASTGVAIGNSLMTPTLNALASKSVGPAWQGRVLGVLSSVASLARIIGPVLGGFLLIRDSATLAHYGRTPYWTSAAIMLIALGLSISVRVNPGRAKTDAVESETGRV